MLVAMAVLLVAIVRTLEQPLLVQAVEHLVLLKEMLVLLVCRTTVTRLATTVAVEVAALVEQV